jgi:hypothetical protein
MKVNSISLPYPKLTLFDLLKSKPKKRNKKPIPPDSALIGNAILGCISGIYFGISYIAKALTVSDLLITIFGNSVLMGLGIYLITLTTNIKLERAINNYLVYWLSHTVLYIFVKFAINNLELTQVISHVMPLVISVLFFKFILRSKK